MIAVTMAAAVITMQTGGRLPVTGVPSALTRGQPKKSKFKRCITCPMRHVLQHHPIKNKQQQLSKHEHNDCRNFPDGTAKALTSLLDG
mmetsp:Transcript_15715/g.36192  ORF Transcript_15715/g.36192 Transcript_15715/m.36192 type:complete len:88 (-) Transcript_15715:198-461(-)